MGSMGIFAETWNLMQHQQAKPVKEDLYRMIWKQGHPQNATSVFSFLFGPSHC